MLSPGVTSTPAVVSLSGGPGASDSHSGARAVAGHQAQQAEEVGLSVQSAPTGQQASGPFLLKDGFMQFEGPTYPSEGSTLSIQSAEDGTSGSGDVQVVLAAAGSDPRVLYDHASSPDRQAGLLRKQGAVVADRGWRGGWVCWIQAQTTAAVCAQRPLQAGGAGWRAGRHGPDHVWPAPDHAHPGEAGQTGHGAGRGDGA